MAKKDFYVDIDLHGSEIQNFAIETVPSTEAMNRLRGFNGRTVFNKEDGHLYAYVVNDEDPSKSGWVKQARYEDIEKAIAEDPSIIDKINEMVENNPVIAELEESKLDKIDEAGKIYGTALNEETGEVEQVAYDVDSFLDLDSDQTITGDKTFTGDVDLTGANATAATQTQGDNSNNIATTAYVDTAISNLDEEKLDKITTANKVYGTDENGNQTSYDVDSFGKVDDVKVGGTSVVTNKIAELGTMAGESKDDYVLTEIDNGANGKAYVWNETSGGGIRYEKGNDKVFVGVNGGNEGGEFVSIYAKNGTPADTKRIIVKSDGAYYLKNNGIVTTGNDEIATKGDVLAKDSLPERTSETAGQFLTNDGTDASWADLPEYTIAKDAQAETGYAHTYHLQKDGVNVGASINIPLDMVVKSGEVKVCEIDDEPVPGYKVGDKYIDLELANSDDSHLYILVSDLVDVYTEGDGINISNNTISVDTTDTTIVDTTPTANSVKFVQSGGVKTELDKKVDIEIDNGANGKSYIWNETSGGGARYEKGNDKVFVGVNGGNEAGEFVSIYAKNATPADTKRVIVKTDGAYYLKGNGIATTANDEIATKGDITSAISNTKQVELSPILTADANGEYTWTITNNMGADAVVSLYKKDEQNRFVEVMADFTVTSSNVIIKMYESEDLPSPVSAGEFKAVILG